ncbi:uncharacterized protein LOC111630920 [Centruroides sculpturatus]|uniref:uncharacterized protein LOC111630920 n=1 Tax=Centruroides sculpturatus TaxID=218467 RepID=UPI000C6EF472|nr:uncharacterized protein LOC111630920 [Centruroides sculpturatus]
MLRTGRRVAARAEEHLRKLEAGDVQFDARRARDVYLNAVRAERVPEGDRREQHYREARVDLEAVTRSGVPRPFSFGATAQPDVSGGGVGRLCKYLSDRRQRTHQSNQGAAGGKLVGRASSSASNFIHNKPPQP